MEPFEREQRSLNRTPLEAQDILSGEFWGELRVFLAVAKAKSFNRAAEILNTSQPRVARQVKRLQDLMGSQLFVPTKNGVQLTQKGQLLAESLTRLDQSLYALSNELRAETKEAEGVVRVSITDGLNAFFVAPTLRSFSDEFPKVQLHLKNPTNVVSLRENQTDMMVGFIPDDSADIHTEKLGYLHFIPIASTEYIESYGLPKRENLQGHYFVQSELYAARTGLWDQWNRMVSRGQVSHFCDNSIAYGMLVKTGLGIGLLGSYTVILPNFVPLELDTKISVPLYALALTERLNARPVRLAFDWFCDIFGTGNPWFSDEFRLKHPPGNHDRGMRTLFNV